MGFTRQPTGALPPAIFNAVSCASPTFGVADGSELPQPGVTVPYVESYNDTTWAAQSTTRTGQFLVTPPNTTDATLLGASCPSAGACQVVGIYGNSGGSIDSIWAAGFDGRAWASEANPYVFANATFQGVSCTSSDHRRRALARDSARRAEADRAQQWRR